MIDEIDFEAKIFNQDCEFMVLRCDRDGLQISTDFGRVTMGYSDLESLVEKVTEYKKLGSILKD